MLRLAGLFCIFLTTFPAFGQSTSKYQVGTITEVKAHQAAGSGASDAASYDVSVKVATPFTWCCISQHLARRPLNMLRDVTCSCSWGKTQLPTTTFWVDHLRFRSRAKNPPRTINSPNQFRERRSSVHRQLFLESFGRTATRSVPLFRRRSCTQAER